MTYRVGVIGSGFIAGVHSAAWNALGHPVTDLLIRAGSTVPEELLRKGARVHTDQDEFLAAVDLVDICAPTHLHADLALAAARACRPTFCEKPLALTSADARHVADTFHEACLTLMVGHVVRFQPEYVAVRDALRSGGVGDAAVLRMETRSFAPLAGRDSWFTDDAKSGGIVLDLMIHDLDYARWLLGPVDTVYARAAAGGAGHAMAILRHESGALSHLEVSWAYPRPTFRTLLELAGSTGVVGFDSETTRPMEVAMHQPTTGADTGLGDLDVGANPFELELRHFVDQVDGGESNVLTPTDAVEAIVLAEAVRTSVATGHVVTIPRSIHQHVVR